MVELSRRICAQLEAVGRTFSHFTPIRTELRFLRRSEPINLASISINGTPFRGQRD